MKQLISISLAVIVIVFGKWVIVAQETGKWKGEYWTERAETIQLSFNKKAEKRSQMGTSFKIAELQGVTVADLTGSNTPVRFSIVRDAGTIACEGTFNDRKGSGDYRFTTDPGFLSAMKSRGFDFEKSDMREGGSTLTDRLFSAALLNVTVALADDLLSSDFGKLDVEDLFKAAIFKIDGKFARDMKATGFRNLTFDDLVQARIFKIDAEFVREVAQMGFADLPFESLVKMRIFKISPEYMAEMKAEGLTDLDIEDLVKLRIFNIDAAFIRKAKSEGVPLDVEKLVQKKLGVYR